MIVTIKRDAGKTKWQYPDKPELFESMAIGNDTVKAKYHGNKSIAELKLAGIEIDEVPPEDEYKILVSFGELKDLFGATAFAKVFRAAYPPGTKAPDDMALFFFERAKDPTHPSGKIDLSDPILDQGLQYFISKGYITTDDAARIKQGVKL